MLGSWLEAVRQPALDSTFALSKLESSCSTRCIQAEHDSITGRSTQRADERRAAKQRPPDVEHVCGLLLGSPEFQKVALGR